MNRNQREIQILRGRERAAFIIGRKGKMGFIQDQVQESRVEKDWKTPIVIQGGKER